MTPVEFQRQVFRTPEQWKYGLARGLKEMEEGGFEPFLRLAFVDWVVEGACAESLAVDQCGRLFWIDARACALYCYDPASQRSEEVLRFDDICRRQDQKSCPVKRVRYGADRLWLLDFEGRRVLSLRPGTFQILTEIDELSEPKDFAVCCDLIFVLDGKRVLVYDIHGRPVDASFDEKALQDPIAIACSSDGMYVYVLDRSKKSIVRFSRDRNWQADEIGDFNDVYKCFQPCLLAVNCEGNLFVSDGTSGLVHEFAQDGSYLGELQAPESPPPINDLAFSNNGALYAATSNRPNKEKVPPKVKGIARYQPNSGFVDPEEGGDKKADQAKPTRKVFYSRTLDNGSRNREMWHRLDLDMSISPRAALDVYYASSDEEGLAVQVEAVFRDDRQTEAAKQSNLEALLGNRWSKSPEHFTAPVKPPDQKSAMASETALPASGRHSMLFREDTGRYLWLKLVFSLFDPQARLQVLEMQVIYPRLSYLRYLPAEYQQDPASRNFLERFLSIFETTFQGLESRIDAITNVFNTDLAPPQFLDWLAQWLNLALEEDWGPAIKRQLISRAPALYRRKGTPEGIADFVEAITGTRPLLLEHAQRGRPLILGAHVFLGYDAVLLPTPVRGFKLGQSAILGRSAIRDVVQTPSDPFQERAYRFTLLLDMTREEYARSDRIVRRILRESVPAHVFYRIRLIAETGLGPHTFLGVNMRVEDYRPFVVGIHSTLGRSVSLTDPSAGAQLEE